MFTLVNNFHSFYWTLTLKNQIIVTSISLVHMLHRYGDFSTLKDSFSVSQDGRYVTFTYFGLYAGQNQYIHALYDLEDYSANTGSTDNFTNCFILEVVTAKQNHQLQFVHTNPDPEQSSNTNIDILGVGLGEDGRNIKIYSISNSFRALIHNA